MKFLIALLLAAVGAAWLAAMAIWTRPLLDPSYQAGWDFLGSMLITLGLPVGAIFGFSVVFWFPKLPKWGRYLTALLVLSSALYGFGVYSHNMRVLNQRLFASVEAKDIDGAEKSLDHDANINAANAAGLTPLTIALNQKDCAMVECLMGYSPHRSTQEDERMRSVCEEQYPAN